MPDRSDRAIAADLGVNRSTVTRARAKTGGANAPRIGKDGKKYPSKKKPAKKKEAKKSDTNLFVQRVAEFSQRYASDLNQWLRSQPEISREAIASLSNALHVCGEEFERLARAIQEISPRGGRQ
jgi:hypothetical protein